MEISYVLIINNVYGYVIRIIEKFEVILRKSQIKMALKKLKVYFFTKYMTWRLNFIVKCIKNDYSSLIFLQLIKFVFFVCFFYFLFIFYFIKLLCLFQMKRDITKS